MRIQSRQDFWSGLLFVVLGAFFAWKARSYSMGTAADMGPGYLPFWLGTCLSLLGALIALMALNPRRQADHVARPDWRVLVPLIASIVLFSVSLRTFGLFVSLALLIGISSLACHRVHWKTVVANAVFLMLFSWLVFVQGLGLVLPLWPAWPPR